MSSAYVHGYDPHENNRLQDQAADLIDLLHGDTAYPAGSRILEAGCGVGAQTITLAQRSPGASIVSIDISPDSVAQAEQRLRTAGFTNVEFHQGDLFNLPFAAQSFDHLFVCFVLEHLPNVQEALQRLKVLLKPNGTITVIEGDHGSTYFYPESSAAQAVIDCQVKLQAAAGGNARIGRALYPLLTAAGYRDVSVSPRMVYVDASTPNRVEGFTKKTFIAMIEGVRPAALSAGIIDAQTFDQGIADLYRTTEPDGTFCYTFFKATGRV